MSGGASGRAERRGATGALARGRAWARFRERFRGRLVFPGDGDYEALRVVFNGAIDRRPAVIACPGDVPDVQAVVRFAREQGVALTVRGGGHAIAGYALSDGAVCVDLRSLRWIDVDRPAGRVRVQAGVSWGELDRATAAAGLVVPGGRAASTGVAGVTLGSGSGWLERQHGLSADCLCSADVVRADGRVVVASPRADPDLFWGICGGGGNLGLVTKLEFAPRPMPARVLAGMLLFSGQRAPEVVAGFQELLGAAPDELGVMLALLTAPNADWVPEPLRGRPAIAALGGWLGAPERGQRLVGQLRALAPVALDTIAPIGYLQLQRLLEPGPAGALRHHWSADCLSQLPAAAIETLIGHAAQMPSTLSQTLLMAGGGALQRASSDTLLTARHAPWSVHVIAMWSDRAEDERHRAWVQTLRDQLAPWITGRNYLNFADADPGALRDALGPGPHARLAGLKRRHDPTNLFSHNPNVTPTPTSAQQPTQPRPSTALTRNPS